MHRKCTAILVFSTVFMHGNSNENSFSLGSPSVPCAKNKNGICLEYFIDRVGRFTRQRLSIKI